MYTQASPVHAKFDPAQCRPFVKGVDYSLDEMDQLLPMLGIGFGKGVKEGLARHMGEGMDTIQGLNVTAASIATPVQFLQNWLPGFVATLTAARVIDDLIGFTTVGNWGDEQIVQQVLELTGTPTVYGDLNNVPLSNWNQNFVFRTLVRFELGMQVGPLEEYRAAQVRIDSAAQKRSSSALQLEIQRNAVGFYGYNGGNNLTYGFLTDPNLPAYQTVATGAVSSSKLWSLKTFDEIQADIVTAIQTIRTQSQDVIDPSKVAMTLAVPTNSIDYLMKVNSFGISVKMWLTQTYPNITVKSAPQLNSANGGSNVFYLYANKVDDGLSTDDHNTFAQIVPAKFQLLGVQQLTKGYMEDYSNASAGVLLKRPFAVYRGSGI